MFAGEGSLKRRMMRRLQSRGLTRDVVFLSALSRLQVADWMRISDMLVMTAAFEAMPMAVLEAQAVVCRWLPPTLAR